jgi:hypothetical protein
MDNAGKVKAKYLAEKSQLPNSFVGGMDKIVIGEL